MIQEVHMLPYMFLSKCVYSMMFYDVTPQLIKTDIAAKPSTKSHMPILITEYYTAKPFYFRLSLCIQELKLHEDVANSIVWTQLFVMTYRQY